MTIRLEIEIVQQNYFVENGKLSFLIKHHIDSISAIHIVAGLNKKEKNQQDNNNNNNNNNYKRIW